ncbi:MAG: archaetidylserine decarboxylase, partial [Leptospiraceae bacterium]|nr:archaetidylserine decarboxylase [Leptospiraceae bacterium]
GRENEGTSIPKSTRAGEVPHLRAILLTGSIHTYAAILIGIPVLVLWGGVAALLWTMILGVLLASLRFAQGILAVKYREKAEKNWLGGAAAIIAGGFPGRQFALIYAALGVAAVLVWGALTQAELWHNFFEPATHIKTQKQALPYRLDEHAFAGQSALLLMAVVGLFFTLGGIRRIGRVAAWLVPTATALLLLLAAYLIAQNVQKSWQLFHQGCSQALNWKGLVAGGFTTLLIFQCASFNGVVAPEAATGLATPIIAASVNDYPVKQGLISMSAALFYSTIVVPLLGLAYAVGLPELPAVQGKAISSPISAAGLAQAMQFSFAHIFTAGLGRGAFFVLAVALFLLGTVAIAVWIAILDRLLWALRLGGWLWLFRLCYLSLFIFSPALASLAPKLQISAVLLGLMALLFTATLLARAGEVRKEAVAYFAQYPHRHDLAVQFYVLLLRLLPKNTVSKASGFLAGLRLPRFIMTPVILAFAKIYKINIQEAELEVRDYESLNKFFTRALKNGARLIDQKENVVISPVDGTILVAGSLERGLLLQSKGMESTLSGVLGNDRFYKNFLGGHYITIYLSPQDYHRIHAPVDGRIIGYYYQPGKLFPVNNIAVNTINQLFSRNERLITYIQSDYGLVAVVKIGATSVGKIRVTYDPTIATNRWVRLPREHFYEEEIRIRKGAELGRFEMGSTVMLLFEKDTVELLDFEERQRVLLGQPIAVFTRQKPKTKPKEPHKRARVKGVQR